MSDINYINELIKIIEDNNYKKDRFKIYELKETKIFDSFYIEIINYFETELRKVLKKFNNRKIDINNEEIILNCIYSFRSDLIGLCKKVLISEIYKMKDKGELIGKTKVERYNYFDNLLKGEKRLEIIKKNQVLAYLIINKFNTKLSHISECLERLNNDFDKISKEFHIEITTLNRMILDEGDTHNNGRSVITLEFNDNFNLVYKPHSLESDESFIRFINYINSSGNLKLDIKVPKVINMNSYGWQEFIYGKECRSEEEVKAYFYRFGIIIAIFILIRAKDFHYENMVACGEYPIPIDLETVISNRKVDLNFFKNSNNVSKVFLDEIDTSIYSTLVVPQNLEMNKLPFDMSALNGGEGSNESLEFNRITNIGTDEIGYEKVKGTIGRKKNKVKLNGKLIDVKDYVTYIEAGLDECYEFFICKKDEMIELIQSNKIFKGKYRQVLRATEKYVKYLDAAIHPVYTDKFESRYKILCHLYGKVKINDEMKEKIQSEINQLFKNDVPYFWTDFNGKDLHGLDGTVINGYYEKSMCDLIKERIKLASKKDKEKQIYYLKASISGLVKFQDADKVVKNYPSNILNDIKFDKHYKNKYIEMAEKIAEHLEDICIWNSKKDKCTFAALNAQDDGSVKIGMLNQKLYEGLGVVLFLTFLYKITNRKKYLDIINGCMNGYEEIYGRDILENKSGSLFTGNGAIAYVYYNMWKVLGEHKFYCKYKESLKYILKSHIDIDVIYGVSGVIIAISNIFEQEKDDELLDVMKQCGEILYKKLKKDKKEYLTGFSHGYAGFSTALFILSYYLNNDEYYCLAKELIIKEDTYIKDDNWMDLRNKESQANPVYWCHGATGITLSRVLSKRFLRDEDKQILDKDIEMGINKILHDGFYFTNHCLCHGTFGNLDCLLSIGNRINDKKLIDIVYKLADIECLNMIENGVICANPLKVETINFMLGISGIGYELLRLHDNTIPSVLSMEVFKDN